MNRLTNLRKSIGSLVILALALGGCVKHDIYTSGKKVTIDDYFDFATTKSVQLDVHYQNGGKWLFEVYAENPMTVEDGQLVKKENLVALAKGFTDDAGNYNLKSSLPASLKEAYIYTAAFGAPRLFKATVNGNTLRADISFESAIDLSAMLETKTRALAGDRNIKDHFPSRLSEWNGKGKPTGIYEEGKITVDNRLKQYINSNLPEGGGAGIYKTFVSDNADITLYKAASKVVINYLGGTTNAKNVFGYYCYPADASLEQIRKAAENACVIFPNAHPDALGNNSGIAMKLRYINENGELEGERFPAGVKIGFVLWNNGWKGGNDGKKYEKEVFYSTKALNGNLNMSCTAVLGIKDKNENKYNAIAFEDWPIGNNSTDYNDVIFSISSDPEEAIVVPPAPDPEPQFTTEVYEGLLCFEDNWPYQGDYDMNDVIVKYNSNVTSNDKNEVVSVVDKYTLIWSGANFKDGFGYSLPVDLNGVEVKLSEGASIDENVVYLFENAKKELGVPEIPAISMPGMAVEQKAYTVSMEFKNASVIKDNLLPPYDPFIVINQSRTEVHLVNHKPTKHADNEFPNQADISDGVNTFFVSEFNYPFAFHLDARTHKEVMKLNYQAEGIRIDAVYPEFTDWADSKGQNNTDWYLHPKK